MNYTVDELNPSRPCVQVAGKEIEFSLVTLKLEVVFADKYGSTAGIFDILKSNPERILELTWEFLHNKSIFDFSFKIFSDFILSSKEDMKALGESLTTAIFSSVSKSMPLIKNVDRHKDIQELKQTAENKSPCYGVYYDSIAKRYNYTLEEFYGLTLRQIHIFLGVIGAEAYKEFELQAALHNQKLKPKIDYNDDVTPEEEKDNEDQAMDALARLKKEYEDKQKDK